MAFVFFNNIFAALFQVELDPAHHACHSVIDQGYQQPAQGAGNGIDQAAPEDHQEGGKGINRPVTEISYRSTRIRAPKIHPRNQ